MTNVCACELHRFSPSLSAYDDSFKRTLPEKTRETEFYINQCKCEFSSISFLQHLTYRSMHVAQRSYVPSWFSYLTYLTEL